MGWQNGGVLCDKGKRMKDEKKAMVKLRAMKPEQARFLSFLSVIIILVFGAKLVQETNERI